jgi:hypothetical protein
MHKSDYYFAFALAMLAGFIGGCMSGRLVSPEPVVAQETARRTRVIDAEAFRLFDQNGRLRAVLEAAPDGSVGFAMGSKDGALRARLGVDARGDAVLDLKDEKAQTRAKLVVSHTGRPTLLLLDRIGRGDAVLGEVIIPISDVGIVEERPAGSLILTNKDGKVVWRMP